jgi:U3 small nucleolar RNA-associated protein 20
MRSSSAGRIVKTSKRKKGTAHQKNHRWESFTAKVAKLNSLDPLKRVRRHDLDTEDIAATTSYFKNSLERWQELNVSGRFIEFTQEVTPLCDSLPQIIHFEDRIMDLLATHLRSNERESVEPLLQLLTDFAHDLGTRFEKHYPRALELVISIARTSQGVEVIEWSFACLAFMFKYLSKLLVSDLRPTYDLMAPLLGKERQKPHIARFAAEAMSFLVRKAAAPAVREKALDTIVRHAKLDLLSIHGSREYGLYYHGLMTLFAEAMKGNGLSIHSSAAAMITCMFGQLDEVEYEDGQTDPWTDVICGVLTSLIHHASSDTLKDVIATVLDLSKNARKAFEIAQTKSNFRRLMLSARTVGIIAGVRKGSRVSDWPALLSALSIVLEVLVQRATQMSDFEVDPRLWNSVILSTAISLQYGPMDALIPVVSTYMSALTKDPLARWFLTFCSYFAEVEMERFRSIVMPYFQRYAGQVLFLISTNIIHVVSS